MIVACLINFPLSGFAIPTAGAAVLSEGHRSGRTTGQLAQLPTDSGYVLQLAALRNASFVDPSWQYFQQAFPDLLGDMKLIVEEAMVDGIHFYRIQTGPFPTKRTAEDLCAQLKERNQDCFIKRKKK